MVDFSHIGDGGEFAANRLSRALERAAEELSHHANAVIIFDDFNYCVGPCSRMLRKLLTSHVVETEDGRIVSAREALIILTSDLHQFGLQLEPGEIYEQSLKRVGDAAKEYWTESSVFLSRALLVPFASLSERDLLKILDMILKKAERRLHLRLQEALHVEAKSQSNKENKLDTGKVTQYKWLGQLKIKEDTKYAMIDRMSSASQSANARAITEELWAMIRKAMRHPTPIESRLLAETPKIARDGSMYYSNDVELVVKPGKTQFDAWIAFKVDHTRRRPKTSRDEL